MTSYLEFLSFKKSLYEIIAGREKIIKIAKKYPKGSNRKSITPSISVGLDPMPIKYERLNFSLTV